MVWLALSACTVIAIMFLYHWINNGHSSTHVEEDQSAPTTPSIDKDNDSVLDQPSHQKEPTTMSSQSATTITISEPDSDQPSADIDKKDGTPTNTGKLSAIAKDMPPPPPPASRNTLIPANTAQPTKRAASPPRLKPPTFGARPPSLRPNGNNLRTPPSAAATLRVPATKVLSNASMAPSALMPPPQKKSRQVTLEPGHSPLDWAALTSNPNNRLRGKDAPNHLARITPSQLKAQNGRKGTDAWTVFQGKVYNITPYVPFHPGGKGEILRGAGKDSAKLFMEVHPWVNWDGMLSECCVGILVGEDEIRAGEAGNQLDEMD